MKGGTISFLPSFYVHARATSKNEDQPCIELNLLFFMSMRAFVSHSPPEQLRHHRRFNNTNMTRQTNIGPTTEKQRYIILDALRGMALLAIILANFPEFGLWSFLSGEERQMMPTASTDNVVRYMQYFLIDGKGYTLFSLLFGCGFSIILEHALQRGTGGILLFYRRMTILLLMAFCHLMFIWSGDILCLYATLGMILPLFHQLSNKGLLWSAGILLFLPVAMDFLQQATGISIAVPIEQAWWAKANSYGIVQTTIFFNRWKFDFICFPVYYYNNRICDRLFRCSIESLIL